MNGNFRADTDINNLGDYKDLSIFADSCSFFISLLAVAEAYASCEGTGGGRRESDGRGRSLGNFECARNFVPASET